MFLKQIKRPWHAKSFLNFKTPKVSLIPGQVVLVDQLVFPTPGFIAKINVILTTKLYYFTTV